MGKFKDLTISGKITITLFFTSIVCLIIGFPIIFYLAFLLESLVLLTLFPAIIMILIAYLLLISFKTAPNYLLKNDDYLKEAKSALIFIILFLSITIITTLFNLLFFN